MDILLRFRVHTVAIAADIEKTLLMIAVRMKIFTFYGSCGNSNVPDGTV